jgi:hypothetical protein
MPFERYWLEDRDDWLRRQDLLPGTPFLISPGFEYDVVVNGFFADVPMAVRSQRTQEGYARDLAAFFNSSGWPGTAGRGVTPRRLTIWPICSGGGVTPPGHGSPGRRGTVRWPRSASSTSGRPGAGTCGVNPVPQPARRRAPAEAGWAARRDGGEQRPATYARDAVRERVEWMPPASYRLWRDVGVRGFAPGGLPGEGFRGRWAARNAVFCDLMVRTGLRLSEQAAVTVPLDRTADGYQRFWLPAAIAKGGSARWIYVPAVGDR